MKTPKPIDFLILVFILVLSFFLMSQKSKPGGDVVMIEADGTSFEYSLRENKVYQVEGPLGITTVEVKDGQVRIIDSPCSGKTCINQGWSSPIVCLPNKVIVTIENYGEFDAVSE